MAKPTSKTKTLQLNQIRTSRSKPSKLKVANAPDVYLELNRYSCLKSNTQDSVQHEKQICSGHAHYIMHNSDTIHNSQYNPDSTTQQQIKPRISAH